MLAACMLIYEQTMASVEAYIDFSEEENIEEDVIDRVRDSLHTIIDNINNHLSDGNNITITT